MKVLAKCPRCGVRIPRYFVLAAGPLVDVTCPACGRALRFDERTERLTGLAFGLPIGTLIFSARLATWHSFSLSSTSRFSARSA